VDMSDTGLPAFAETVGTPLLLHDPETGAARDANEAAALYGCSVAGHAGDSERTLADGRQAEQAALIASVAEDVVDLADSVARIREVATTDAADRTPTDVRAPVADLAAEFEASYPDATVTVEGDDGVRVPADRALRYGLRDAIENAIGHGGGPTPEVTVTVAAEPGDRRARVRVIDDGPPIPEVGIAALDEFAGTTALSHGTGPGPFLMQWCAESLGGTLDITARKEGGTRVEFRLPLCEDIGGEGAAA